MAKSASAHRPCRRSKFGRATVRRLPPAPYASHAMSATAARATGVGLFALAATLHVGCGGAVAATPFGADTDGSSDAAAKAGSVGPDVSTFTDVGAESSFASDGASDVGSTADAAGGSSVGPIDASMGAVDPTSQTDAAAGCECKNLAACCQRIASRSDGTACAAQLAQGGEAACRDVVLKGAFGCLDLGFAPHCSPADETLCPMATGTFSRCLIALPDCGPAIECAVDPACKTRLDAVFACDEQGHSSKECFDLLMAVGIPVPGDLVLKGAGCVMPHQGDR
jgi:hypothetical protein